MKSVLKNGVALGVGAVLCTGFSQEATAQDGDGSCLYARGDIGISILHLSGLSSSPAGFAGGVGLGCQVTPYARVDVTADAVIGYESGAADVDTYGFMANGYLEADFEVVKPYIGAGIGWAQVDGPGGRITDDDDGIAFALMTGAAYELNEGLYLDVGYKFRYVDLSGGNGRSRDHMVRGGLRFHF